MTTRVRGLEAGATDDLGRATVRWVGGLFILCILLQRFAVPGQPVALLLPILVLGTFWGYARGLATFDPRRLTAWLLAAFATALTMVVHATVLDRTLVSITSWGLFVTVWLPFTLRLVDRRLATYVAVLRVVVRATGALAAVCVVMMATQFAGIRYRDWMAELIPPDLLLGGFVITYPISYGSPIYRANAWIGLEPSMVSLYLGVGVVAAILLQARALVLVLLVAGLVAATSGSGFAIVVVALVVIALTPARRLLRRYVGTAVFFIVLAVSTPMGRSILSRLGEGGTDQSSTRLRAISPYGYLWPNWIFEKSSVLFGLGPSSSQATVEQSGIMGLLVPSPIKIFYDYGLLAGAFLAAMILICYFGGHSRAMSLSLLASLWTLQPGTTTILVTAPLLLLVTLWSPRPQEPDLEELVGRSVRAGRGRSGTRDPVDVEPSTPRGTYAH